MQLPCKAGLSSIPTGIGRSAAGELEHASIEARRLTQGSPLVSQKWAGLNCLVLYEPITRDERFAVFFSNPSHRH
jgi:hypothetical protein